MKVLGINGSHRKESTTLFFLNKALAICQKEGLETETIELWDKRLEYCRHCNHCRDNPGECATKDDMPGIFRKMRESDAIILASPTYFASISGRMKTLMDRSITLRRDNYALKNRIGGGITIGASRNGGQELVLNQIINFFLLQEMLPVADKQTAHFGGIAWVPRGSKPEEDKTGIETCENLGRKICEVLKLIHR